jgi:hypothetical protein
MILKSGIRFSENILLNQNAERRCDLISMDRDLLCGAHVDRNIGRDTNPGIMFTNR